MPEDRVKMPPPPKGIEKEFARMMEYMVGQIAQRFKNQVLLELNKGTVEKFSDLEGFADAQVGNYSAITLTLANRVKRKLLRQFNNKRVNDSTRQVLGKASQYNEDRVYNPVQDIIGIDTATLIAKEGLTPDVNALMIETAQWAKKLRDDTLEHFTANTLRAMSLGKPISEIIEEFDAEALKSKTKAQFIARNQISNFNGMSTKIRHQKLGIKKGTWITSRDERVRECHRRRDGKEFELSKGLFSSCDGKSLFPGQDFNCRCTYRALDPELEIEK